MTRPNFFDANAADRLPVLLMTVKFRSQFIPSRPLEGKTPRASDGQPKQKMGIRTINLCRQGTCGATMTFGRDALRERASPSYLHLMLDFHHPLRPRTLTI